MDRRVFVAGTVGFFAAPLNAAGQPAGKAWRIGLLVPGRPPDCGIDSQPAVSRALRDRLRELGYIEMQSYVFVPRCAEREGEEMLSAARDLVAQHVDVVLVGSNELTEVLKQATTTVPVVFIAVADPEEEGLVASLARPGGNITGFSHLTGELTGKRLQLLKDTLPTIRRVAALTIQKQRQVEQEAARLGLQIQPFIVRQPGEIGTAFSAMRAARPDALLVHPHPMLLAGASAHHTSRCGSWPPGDLRERGLRAGRWPHGVWCQPSRHGTACRRIHRPNPQGAKPADLPVEQPTKFELVDQPEDRESPRPHDPALGAGAGG